MADTQSHIYILTNPDLLFERPYILLLQTQMEYAHIGLSCDLNQ